MDYNYEAQMHFDDESVRRGFIRKVYSILFTQLLVSVGVVSLFTFSVKVQDFVSHNIWILIVAIVVNIVLVIMLVCCEGVRRKAPMNFIVLGLFTLTEGFLLGVIAASYNSSEVMIALGMCAVVVFSLTIFSFQTKMDFTKWGGALFACFIIFFIFSLLAFIFMKGRLMQLIIAAVGACIFSLFIIYDTQLMLGGKHKYSISPEEYIFASLNLYLDIINLFIYILQFIGASRS
ncbi:protein lifeguard 1-like isoform X1 [Cimex lectularius]|uniref:Protein lifeguard 1 n=1 Tax=Cimex lectularius TaxID=79782 RepID=A0A8I6RMX7_CIMLE|nr:protein lifeguard 1-like isoform X1 [Cimex lectularius]XP_014248374.1 protein lifeguard 1-like isoform X1 [Cimex lectularius]